MTTSVVLNRPGSRSYNNINSRFHEVSKLSKGNSQDVILPIDVIAVYPTSDLLEIIDEWDIKFYSTGTHMYAKDNIKISLSNTYFDARLELDPKLDLNYIIISLPNENTYKAILAALISKTITSCIVYSGTCILYDLSIINIMEHINFISTMDLIKSSSAADSIVSFIDGPLLETIQLINKIIKESGKELPDILKLFKSIDKTKSELSASNIKVKKLESKNEKLKKKIKKLEDKDKTPNTPEDETKKKKKKFSLFNKKSNSDDLSLSPGLSAISSPSMLPPYVTNSPYTTSLSPSSSSASSLVF